MHKHMTLTVFHRPLCQGLFPSWPGMDGPYIFCEVKIHYVRLAEKLFHITYFKLALWQVCNIYIFLHVYLIL